MTNQNNTPTRPGWYYRESVTMPESQVYVNDRGSKGLQYCVAGIKGWNDVENDGLWLGPVPMPGEWAPMDLFNQLWTALSMTYPARGTVDYMLLQRATAWDDPEVTL